MDFKFLDEKEYAFVNSPPLKDNIMLLTLGGSHAYGTNIDTPEHKSDIDLRGIMFNTRDEILLGKEPDQYIDNSTDTVIYSFGKAIKLFLSCNPNMIEMLGTNQYHMLHPMGKLILDNKEAFLSKRCINSFGGYAYQQLSRLENALARDRLSQTKKEEHILNSIKSAMLTFPDRYVDLNGGMQLYVGDSKKAGIDSEIFIDFNLKHYPLRDFTGAMQELLAIQKTYNKINHRNKKKDDVHLNKHAMHLIRLYLMFIDLVRDGKIITYREKEHDLLMRIRNGYYMEEDGTYKQEFFDMLEELKTASEEASEHTVLPDEPDIETVNRLTKEINLYVIERG